MRWLAKAALQKFLSALPGGEDLNYLLQRHLTGSLPRSRRGLLDKFCCALLHYRAACRWGRGDASPPLSAYEFGAGWDLAVPLALYLLGLESQSLVDLRPLVRWELVNHTLENYRRLRPQLEELAGRGLRPLPGGKLCRRRELARRLGIHYLAPRDARHTGLPAGSFHLVSSTQTLEHIPPAHILAILRECRRLLAPGGVISLEVDMQDHYSYFDHRLGPYHFLTLSDRAWSLINSGLHYQNRLRLPDYLEILDQAGLELIHRQVDRPDQRHLAQLEALSLAPRFGGRYRPEDLGALRAWLVCRPG